MLGGGLGHSILSSFITSDSPKHTERSKIQGQASHSDSAEQMTSHTRTHACMQDRADVLAGVKEQFVGITKQNCTMIKSVIINPFWKQESQIDHQGLRRNVRLPHISPFHVHMCDGGRNLLDFSSMCGCVLLLTKLVIICKTFYHLRTSLRTQRYLISKKGILILWHVC